MTFSCIHVSIHHLSSFVSIYMVQATEKHLPNIIHVNRLKMLVKNMPSLIKQ